MFCSSFVHFLKEGSTDTHKNELEQFVLYPLFVNCYIILVSMNRHNEGTLYSTPRYILYLVTNDLRFSIVSLNIIM